MFIVTASDSAYFPRVLSLIGSLHKSNYDNISQIYVYDIGLSSSERSNLDHMQKVTIKQVEKTHPDILKSVLKHPGSQNPTRVIGNYAWKPVAIKQALDMHETVFWIDAGVTILRSLEPIFRHTTLTGYFLLGVSEIGLWLNQYPKQILQVTKEELETVGINAAMQCLNHKYYNTYVLPAYECSKDMNMFIDDGTAFGGVLCGRHDQSLFGVFAARNNMTPCGPNITLATGERIYITDTASQVDGATMIYHSRGDARDNASFIIRKPDENS